jgi:hypothetical protein
MSQGLFSLENQTLNFEIHLTLNFVQLTLNFSVEIHFVPFYRSSSIEVKLTQFGKTKYPTSVHSSVLTIKISVIATEPSIAKKVR